MREIWVHNTVARMLDNDENNLVSGRYLTVANMQEVVWALLPTDTASGAVASFPDGADGVPIESLTVSIEPLQEGSGDPSPDNVRPISGWTAAEVTACGKNLLETDEIVVPDNSKSNTIWSGSMTGSFVLSIEKSGVSSVTNPNEMAAFATVDGVRKPLIYNKGYVAFSGNLTEILVYGSGAHARVVGILKLQLETGTTATAYEPYNGETITHEFHDELGNTITVYGGEDEVVGGKLRVTHKRWSNNGVGAWAETEAGGSRYYIGGQTSDASTIATGWCNIGNLVSSFLMDGIVVQSNGRVNLCGTLHNAFATVDALKAYLAENPIEVIYSLATPLEYDLTAEDIRTLYGDNTIFADCGDVSVTYRADIGLYIDKKLAGQNAALTSNMNNITVLDTVKATFSKRRVK